MDKLPITKAGELKISKQLHQLKTKDRVEISQAIADARAHGDLKENAEYHAAKEEQGFIEAKIQEIEHALANAQVIDVKDIPETGRVVFGSTIDLYDIKNEKSLTYKIVGNLESDPSLGLISIQTPIAMGLLGKNEGDEVTISTPSGDISLEYQTGSVNYGLRANFADTQDRFDSRVLDTGRTGGYTVYDLYAGFEPTPNIRFTMGISNLTDKRYATHLNSTNSLDAAADRVDEPGRSFWGSLIYDF